MTKQVEVPERLACRREFPERSYERCGKPAEFIVWGKLFDKEALGPRCRNCVEDQCGHRAPVDPSYAVYKLPDLELIYKHFTDRLLSDEAVKAGSAAAFVEVSALLESDIRAALEAALQAASIPAGCNCSYDRLVTQEQAFAIRSACPVHGSTPQDKEGR
jgi:hypothetical protein